VICSPTTLSGAGLVAGVTTNASGIKVPLFGFGFFRTDGASARPTGTLGSLLCYIKAAAGKISQGGASGRIGFCLGNQERGLRKEGVSLLTDILQINAD
jgi:hypothetical protein